MSSAVEVEVGTIHFNGNVAIPVRTAIIEMGHPQDPTPLKTNNNSRWILQQKIKPKRSKCFDMKFHWMKNRITQGQVYVYWYKGIYNWLDYFIKHPPP